MKKYQNSWNRPIQWVQPAESHLQRSFFENETGEKSIKKLAMFEEIFPDKNKPNNEIKGMEFIESNDSFHRAIAPVLSIGQCFGILPVLGIRKPDPSNLKFVWFNWHVGFTLIALASSGFLITLSLLRMIIDGVDLFKIIGLMFYCCTAMVLVLFLRLAPRWPNLVMTISQQERPRRLTRRSLRTRFNICCVAILVPALVEHILAILAGLAIAYDCTFGRSLAESYFVSCYPQVFRFSEYSLWKGIFLQIMNLVSTFNWNFMDLFIIVISLGLTDRFNQLNKRLESTKGKNLPEQFWKSVREEFANLSRLVKEVDVAINEIVLLSFANNLYFICVQLFNSLRPLRGLSHSIYFGFSFGFLMTRSLAVSLGAARIHTAARQPASTIYATPSASYGTETQRFLEQVVTDEVALTGLNFFNVTRGLVLTIAGTIVTYELVLVQFNTSPPPVTANITINESCGVPIKA